MLTIDFFPYNDQNVLQAWSNSEQSEFYSALV